MNSLLRGVLNRLFAVLREELIAVYLGGEELSSSMFILSFCSNEYLFDLKYLSVLRLRGLEKGELLCLESLDPEDSTVHPSVFANSGVGSLLAYKSAFFTLFFFLVLDFIFLCYLLAPLL